jgi:2-polyprenyl-3-methyl-5-hydroxy-6-metoxy-1,4-benzoquinol methylase
MEQATSYYESQSVGRRIRTREDVDALARSEAMVYQQVLMPRLAGFREPVIYEAATGPGILQSWLASTGFRDVHGSDFSQTEAELARQTNPRVAHADSLAHLDSFPDEHFDIVIALDFLEHLQREDFRRWLAISHAKLKPSGMLIMRGPNGDSPLVGLNLFNDITHVWCYTSTCLKVLHGLAGFRSVRFEDDALGSIHGGGWWKRGVMHVSRVILRGLLRAATRQQVDHLGSSLYSYALKGEGSADTPR